MHIKALLEKNKPAFSFEFFPPKTPEAAEALFTTISDLEPLEADAVSVTYGAGGSTKGLTHDLVLDIRKRSKLTVISHLTCVDATRAETHEILQTYVDSGIENIMALRGDPPGGTRSFEPHPEGFTYALELVEYIRKHFPGLGIGVAGFPEGHPATSNRLLEIEHLKAKVDAGADYICTQMFFDNHEFYDFVERCRHSGITVPIVAGIMPVPNRKGMNRMAELAAGTRFPAKLLKALDRAETAEYFENVGVHWAASQVMDLLDNGVDGVHFYTLNKSLATRRVYESLGLHSTKAVRSA
ncbi:MAG: methylenetetrahydrofolate reductase [NAD(P)H] [Spirochaetaceae bacterium]|nr:MAG: methylenetetrahydrofolate reductase [NAD(P)H] [Spirochaetaceae bacterium]